MENVIDLLREAAHQAGIEHDSDALLAEAVEYCFDYDGTLAPAGMPHSTTAPNPGIMRGIAKALESGSGVSLVSGKDVNGLRSLLDHPGIKYSGLFGLEYDLNDGHGVHYHPDVTEQQLDAVANVYDILLNQFGNDRFPGIELEHQGSLMQRSEHDSELRQRMLVTTLVWKACDDSFDTEQAIRSVTEIAHEHGLEVHVGTGYINVVPFFPGKSGALEAILFGREENDPDVSKQSPRKTVVFVGDEEPDTDAFAKLRELYDEGRIAAYVNLGVTQPVYDKRDAVVYHWGPVLAEPNRSHDESREEGHDIDIEDGRGNDAPRGNGARPCSTRRVFLETGEHDVDPALALPDDIDDHDHMLLPGPTGVAQFLTTAVRALNVPVSKHVPPQKVSSAHELAHETIIR